MSPLAAARAGGQSLVAVIIAVVVALTSPAPPARAHELQASVADIDLTGGRVTIDMRTNLEAMIAGVGAEHDDTDDSPVTAEYDALRALPPGALRERLAAFAPDLLAALQVTVDGTPVPLALEGVEIDPVGDTALARDSRLALATDLPPGAEAATIRMDPSLGDLIVRGTGENVDYGEFLEGGATSGPIPIAEAGGVWGRVRRLLGLGS